MLDDVAESGLQDVDEDDTVVEDPSRVLQPMDLLSAKLQAIEEVNSIFQIPAGTARQLLAHMNWNKEMLLDRYVLDE